MYMMFNNQRDLVVSYSMAKEIAERMLATSDKPRELVMDQLTECRMSEEQFRRRRAELATGNHRPKNHPVHIPTRAGEPMRG